MAVTNTHYLMYRTDDGNHVPIAGPMYSREVVAIIDSLPDGGTRGRLHNASRYILGKQYGYPQTKRGDFKLIDDLDQYGYIYDLTLQLINEHKEEGQQ